MPETYTEISEVIEIGITATASMLVTDLTEFIATAEAVGVESSTIMSILEADRREAGRIFGAFKNKAGGVVSNAVESTANVSAQDYYREQGIEMFRWQTSGGNVCPDCAEREDDTGTMGYFVSIGLPKSGFSVCRGFCNCTLEAIEYTEETGIIRK